MNDLIRQYVLLKVESDTIEKQMKELQEQILELQEFQEPIEFEGMKVSRMSKTTWKPKEGLSIDRVQKNFPSCVEMKINATKLAKESEENCDKSVSYYVRVDWLPKQI